MNIRDLINRLDNIETVNEELTLQTIDQAVAGKNGSSERAPILMNLAAKNQLPGLYDPVDGYFVSANPDTSNYPEQKPRVSATGSKDDDAKLAQLGLIPQKANTSTWLGHLFHSTDDQYDKNLRSTSNKVVTTAATKQNLEKLTALLAQLEKTIPGGVPTAPTTGEAGKPVATPTPESFNNSFMASALVESFGYQLKEDTLTESEIDALVEGYLAEHLTEMSGSEIFQNLNKPIIEGFEYYTYLDLLIDLGILIGSTVAGTLSAPSGVGPAIAIAANASRISRFVGLLKAAWKFIPGSKYIGSFAKGTKDVAMDLGRGLNPLNILKFFKALVTGKIGLGDLVTKGFSAVMMSIGANAAIDAGKSIYDRVTDNGDVADTTGSTPTANTTGSTPTRTALQGSKTTDTDRKDLEAFLDQQGTEGTNESLTPTEQMTKLRALLESIDTSQQPNVVENAKADFLTHLAGQDARAGAKTGFRAIDRSGMAAKDIVSSQHYEKYAIDGPNGKIWARDLDNPAKFLELDPATFLPKQQTGKALAYKPFTDQVVELNGKQYKFLGAEWQDLATGQMADKITKGQLVKAAEKDAATGVASGYKPKPDQVVDLAPGDLYKWNGAEWAEYNAKTGKTGMTAPKAIQAQITKAGETQSSKGAAATAATATPATKQYAPKKVIAELEKLEKAQLDALTQKVLADATVSAVEKEEIKKFGLKSVVKTSVVVAGLVGAALALKPDGEGKSGAAEPGAAEPGAGAGAGQSGQNPNEARIRELQNALKAKDKLALPRFGVDGLMGKETRAWTAKYPDLAEKFKDVLALPDAPIAGHQSGQSTDPTDVKPESAKIIDPSPEQLAVIQQINQLRYKLSNSTDPQTAQLLQRAQELLTKFGPNAQYITAPPKSKSVPTAAPAAPAAPAPEPTAPSIANESDELARWLKIARG